MTPDSKNQLQVWPLSCLASAMFCSLSSHVYIAYPPLSMKHTQNFTVSNMNPLKYSYLFLVLFLCFRLNLAHNVLDDGNHFPEDTDMEKQDHLVNMINPAKFGAGMGMQFHDDTEMEKQDHFSNMNFPSNFGNGMGMRFHEDIEKEKKDHFGNMINPSKFGDGMGMQFQDDIEKEKKDNYGNMINPSKFGDGMRMHFHEDIEKEKKDRFGNTENPTRGGAGMGMVAYECCNPPRERPCPVHGAPIYGPQPTIPPIGFGPGIGHDAGRFSCCPCPVRCCYQYNMKLKQLRNAKRLRVNEFQNRKTSDDLPQGAAMDESFGSFGQLYH